MEMRFLRKVVGKTRCDKIRNETIRRNLGVSPLQTEIEERKVEGPWEDLDRRGRNK
jgi:hypothetical protein